MTFSLVARDPATGAFGVATATGGPNVGALVPYARPGVGAIATQSMTNPYYGYAGLDMLADGLDPETVLRELTAADEGREKRQCLIVGRAGHPAAWTGAEVLEARNCVIGDDVAAGGNMLLDRDVPAAAFKGFAGAAGQPLEDRLLAALQAGEKAGGDQRGTKSAALKVYLHEDYPLVDIRVDWSTTPISELAEVLRATRESDFQEFLGSIPTRAGSTRR